MPSSLIGKSGDRWQLRHAAATMFQCLRLGVRPSLLWLAGLAFPSVALSFSGLQLVLEILGDYTGIEILELVQRQLPLPWSPAVIANVTDMLEGHSAEPFIAGTALFAIVLPLACRLSAALARIGDERDWKDVAGPRRAPGLGAALSLSKGLTIETLGLWLCLQGLLFGCFGLVMGPLILLINQFKLGGLGNWLLIPLLPPLALIFLYAATLGALNQLALQSLVFNRRGPASALAHAWRLVRHDPWAITRALLVDVGLQLFVFGWNPSKWDFLVVVLLAITGVARACYWARVYTSLGGLRAVDGVPGLSGAPPGAGVSAASASSASKLIRPV
jgi:hypothetical protein